MTRRSGSCFAQAIRHRLGTIGVACLLVANIGCAARWDEMLSHERDWSYITGINKPHPLVAIRDNPTDGTRRAQALAELREPLKNGGNAQDQEAYLSILSKCATSDPVFVCRLTAIRSLGNFHDPRAARILEGVYQQQLLFKEPENNRMIRNQALVALANMHDPESKAFLVRVATGPGPQLDANLADRQETQDEKIVAIRALGNYRDQDSILAIKSILEWRRGGDGVMRTETNVAVRGCAVASLEQATGKRYPTQREAWVKGMPEPVPGTDGIIQQISAWLPGNW